MKGIIVFNIDVGQASLDTMDRIVKQRKEEHKGLVDKLKEMDYETVFLTNRTGVNSIEPLSL